MKAPDYPYVRMKLKPALQIWHDEKTGERKEEVKSRIADVRLMAGSDHESNIMKKFQGGAEFIEYGNFYTEVSQERRITEDMVAFYAQLAEKLDRLIGVKAKPDERARSPEKRT